MATLITMPEVAAGATEAAGDRACGAGELEAAAAAACALPVGGAVGGTVTDEGE
jgi:hypothetical protein